MRTFLESFYDIQELSPNSKLKDVVGTHYLKVYRSSARPNKNDYVSGSHAGTKQQALIRADYMINDEGKYDKYYLYELIAYITEIIFISLSISYTQDRWLFMVHFMFWIT